MDSNLRGIIEKFRDYLYDMNGKAIISLDVISEKTGISREEILTYVPVKRNLWRKYWILKGTGLKRFLKFTISKASMQLRYC